VFKNIAVAASTILGYDFLFMFTGYAIGVEVVFNWPGVGRLAVDATLHEDVVLVSAIVLVTGLIVAIGNMLIDFMHAAIDRRVAN
jgi:peptide/nickel transport system permease protein